MSTQPTSGRKYGPLQFGFELLVSWAVLYFVFPLAYLKVDYLIRSHDPETLLHQVSGMGLDEFSAAAQRAVAAGAGEMEALMAEVSRFNKGDPSGARSSARSGSSKPKRSGRKALAPVSTGPMSGKRAKLVKTAQHYIGTPYLWGGESPSGFDCSGYVQYVYRRSTGVEIPRTSKTQYASSRGRFVSRGSLKPGDLVFFVTRGRTVSHVGMYVGDNKFIHAPSSGNLVRLDSLDDPYFWKDRFVGGKDFI